MAVVEAISTQYLEGPVAVVNFSSIPQTYQHLRLSQSWRGSYNGGGIGMKMRFGDSGGLDTSVGDYSKSMHYSGGSGAAAQGNNGEDCFDFWGTVGDSKDRFEYTTYNCDIMDYTNTSKFTHVRCYNNAIMDSSNAGYYMAWLWGNWRNTNALTQIQISAYGGDLFRGSVFSLYGWKDS